MLNEKSDSKPTTNAADSPIDPNSSQAETDNRRITDATEYSEVTIILASNFDIMGYNSEAKDAAAVDLMALHQP